VAANPADAFARYGLAMECAKRGENEAAAEHFRALLAAHPDYIYGYYHYGQLLVRLERQDGCGYRRGGVLLCILEKIVLCS